MSRVSEIHTPEELPQDASDEERQIVQDLYERLTGGFGIFYASGGGAAPPGEVGASWAVTNHSPELSLRLLELSDLFLSGLGWSQRTDLRELMIQSVGKHTGTEYSFLAHYGIAMEHGIGADQQAGLDFPDSVLFDDEQGLVIRYSYAVVDDEVTDELVAEVRERFGERGLVEFTASICFWIFWTSFLKALEVPLNFGRIVGERRGSETSA